MNSRLLSASQVLGTVLILWLIPTNGAKTAAFVLLWALTFRQLSRPELALFACASAFFSVMNVLSLQQGIFRFTQPDLLGMPLYEFLMWGFYLLHTLRTLDGPAPRSSRLAWGIALLYSAAFGLISDPSILLFVTAALLLFAVACFHEPHDLAYLAYMVCLGAAIEYTGVLSGQWSYPGDPPGGVPLWFVTLWGGVGLLLRRLVLPILSRYGWGTTVSPPMTMRSG